MRIRFGCIHSAIHLAHGRFEFDNPFFKSIIVFWLHSQL
jgi:hypothetical protein